MTETDDRLQRLLEELERGIPLESVLKDIPPDEQELGPLIRLAAQVITVKSPELSVEKASLIQQKFKDVAAPMPLADDRSRPYLPKRLSPGVLAWPFRHKALSGLAMGMVVVLAVLGIWVYRAGPVSAHTATLTNVSGLVEVTERQDAAIWHFITSGETIQQGQMIHTYAGSSVTLVFFDGSQSSIGEDTELALSHLDGGWNKSLQVQLTQNTGGTNNTIIPLVGSASFFHVDTPDGEASVHGTIFGVDVNPGENSLFSVERGIVQVTAGSSQVFLTSGQATLVLPNGTAEPASFQFMLQGELTAVSGQQWTVGGVKFTVNDQTFVAGAPLVKDAISVRGRILDSGEWVADRITPVDKDVEKARFTGQIVSMGSVTWIVGKQILTVDTATEIDAGLKLGDAVEVTFGVQPDGSWLATQIEAQFENVPKPAPTATLVETITPTLTETPEGTITETATPTQTLTPEGSPTVTATVTPTPENTKQPKPPATNVTDCTGNPDKQPEGLVLADRYHVTYDEIMGWFCQHFGFGEIDLAYSMSQQTGKPVADIFAMRQSGLGWGEIKQQLETKPGHGKKTP